MSRMTTWIVRTKPAEIYKSKFDSDFDNWIDIVHYHEISTIFYLKNSSWLEESNGTYSKWLCRLYDKNYSPKKAAYLIERTYNIYFN